MCSPLDFRRFEHPEVDLTLPKLIYTALHLAALVVCLLKARQLGLLPGGTAPLDTRIITNLDRAIQ